MSRLLRPFLLAAALAAGAAGPAVPVQALADPDPRVRAAALAEWTGAAARDPGVIPALVAALGSPDPYLCGAAALALGRIGGPAVPALVQALEQPDPDLRRSAVIALGRAGAAALAAGPALVRALQDPSAEVRQGAAVALGGFGAAARDQAPILTRLLGDPDETVREAAATALRAMDPRGTARPRGTAALAAEIGRLVPGLMAELHVPGVAIALIRNRRLAWSQGFGVRRAGDPAPVTPGSVFEAASMSKPVLAILALQLVERGRMDLDRPLDARGREGILPELPERTRITARMALSHTTGLPNWRPGGEEREGPIPQLFRPGARFSYSGEGVFFLQRALERITGTPLAPWADRALFRPLGLAATGYQWTPELGDLQATGHGDDGQPLERSRYLHANAAYTLYSSAEDYARILVEVLRAVRGESRLLSRSSARAAVARQVRLDAREPIERPGRARGTEVYWGLGWSLNATGQGLIAHHSGSNRTGFRCFSQFSPARGTGLVIFTNGTRGGELWTRLVAAVGDLEGPPDSL